MGIETNIEWSDSTCNVMMGCDGCELWVPEKGIRHCYAGVMTGKYAGRKGWPDSFEQPKIFMDRLDKAIAWPDLTGTKRPEKPWLDGMPRIIFLNDMGDTFTEGLPVDWLAPALPRIAASPHIWMFLTKRVGRMVEFFRQHGLPKNCWPGTTITGPQTLSRARQLLKLSEASVLWLSIEPLLERVNIRGLLMQGNHPGMCANCGHGHGFIRCPNYGGISPTHTTDSGRLICKEFKRKNFAISLAIVGGESGPGARPFHINWARDIIRDCKAASVPCFMKQLGSVPVMDEEEWRGLNPTPLLWAKNSTRAPSGTVPLRMADGKGGEPLQWPADLRVRQMPEVAW